MGTSQFGSEDSANCAVTVLFFVSTEAFKHFFERFLLMLSKFRFVTFEDCFTQFTNIDCRFQSITTRF